MAMPAYRKLVPREERDIYIPGRDLVHIGGYYGPIALVLRVNSEGHELLIPGLGVDFLPYARQNSHTSALYHQGHRFFGFDRLSEEVAADIFTDKEVLRVSYLECIAREEGSFIFARNFVKRQHELISEGLARHYEAIAKQIIAAKIKIVL